MKPRVLLVHVTPNASQSAISGWEDRPENHPGEGKVLRVRLAAPPVDGKANQALIRFLAEAGGVRRQEVQLRAGAASRWKSVEVPLAWRLPDAPDA